MRKIAVFALFALASIPAQIGQVAEVKAGSSCPANWKELVSKYPYDDKRGGHLGYLLTNPYFPKDACFCDINYRSIVDWGSPNGAGGRDFITDWQKQCGHTLPDLWS